jgi:hypothetical protein
MQTTKVHSEKTTTQGSSGAPQHGLQKPAPALPVPTQAHTPGQVPGTAEQQITTEINSNGPY